MRTLERLVATILMTRTVRMRAVVMRLATVGPIVAYFAAMRIVMPLLARVSPVRMRVIAA